jgi:hypothetical protein
VTPEQEARLAEALRHVEMGFRVFSVWPTDPDGTCRCPNGANCVDSPGKHPIPPNGFHAGSRDHGRVRAMLSAAIDPNYGLCWPEHDRRRVVILDIDGDDWKAKIEALKATHGPLPATKTTRTPSGGLHLFYLWPDDVPLPDGNQFHGFVIRLPWKGYVVGPLSRIGTVAYLDLGIDEIAELPRAWADGAATTGALITVTGNGFVVPDVIPEGSRHDAIRDYVASRWNKGLPKDEIVELVRRVVVPRFAKPMPEERLAEEIERGFDTARRKWSEPAGASRPPPPPPTIPPNLPATFWEARPALTRIRDAAWSRQRSPDAVFAGVLTRLTAALPHEIALPPIAGTAAGTGLIAAIVAGTGGGKSSSAGVAREVTTGGIEVRSIPGGTGEGMVEALFDMVEVEVTKNGKTSKTRVRQQVSHNLFAYVDEVTKMLKVGGRDGATVYEMLRQSFSGTDLGEQNATAERRRVVRQGQYSVGILIAAQPVALGPLFEDLDLGTPGRFVWLSGTDPGIPDSAPPFPTGQIDLDLPAGWNVTLFDNANIGSPWRYHARVDQAVADEIRGRDLVKSRGQGNGDAWGGHRDLIRLKVAFALAVLDHRVEVRPSDWALSGIVADTSDAVRAYAEKVVGARARRDEDDVTGRVVRREIAKQEALTVNAVVAVARWIGSLVWQEPDGSLSPGKARSLLYRPRREHFDDGLEHAKQSGWVRVVEEAGQGTDKSRLRRGEVKPA